MNNSTWAV